MRSAPAWDECGILRPSRYPACESHPRSSYACHSRETAFENIPDLDVGLEYSSRARVNVDAIDFKQSI